jgi:hypothetical protein
MRSTELSPSSKEALLVFRMVRVVNQEGVLVREDRSSLVERDAVLSLVQGALSSVPLKTQTRHADSVPTS